MLHKITDEFLFIVTQQITVAKKSKNQLLHYDELTKKIHLDQQTVFAPAGLVDNEYEYKLYRHPPILIIIRNVHEHTSKIFNQELWVESLKNTANRVYFQVF